jgi:DNA-binding MarR family transcriptional regulator
VAEANDLIRKKGFDFVRAPHIAVIAQIDENGTDLSRVVRRVGTSKQAVNKVIRQLEELGIIEAHVSESDSRARVLRFTREGRRFLKTALEAVRTVEETYARTLGKREFESFRNSLARLAAGRGVFTRSYEDD